MITLSREDAIYVTSWAAYNEGRAVGGWFNLNDLSELTLEEIMDEFKKTGLDPYGRDEELVVHDFDDYTGVGYYELFGEPYPLTVVDFYRQLKELDEEELAAFIGLVEDHGSTVALENLEEGTLDNWGVYDEETFKDFAAEIAQSYIESGDLPYIMDFIDREQIRRELEMEVSYDEQGLPEYEIDDYLLDDFIQSLDQERLGYYLDLDDFARYLATDYSEFEHDGSKYYLYER